MLDDVSELRTFVRIVGAGSLSAAGREMGLSSASGLRCLNAGQGRAFSPAAPVTLR
jgi:hypothetical protein